MKNFKNRSITDFNLRSNDSCHEDGLKSAVIGSTWRQPQEPLTLLGTFGLLTITYSFGAAMRANFKFVATAFFQFSGERKFAFSGAADLGS
jgi:hypothetical protein